jgi:hypothetical protein
MQTRIHQWLDTKRWKPVFGVQVKANGRWCHLHRNGRPCFFKTEAAANRLREQMRRKPEGKA